MDRDQFPSCVPWTTLPTTDLVVLAVPAKKLHPASAGDMIPVLWAASVRLSANNWIMVETWGGPPPPMRMSAVVGTGGAVPT